MPVQRLVPAGDGVELCVEERGTPDAPVLLLIGGATWSMDWWEDAFCDLLADHGLRVIRYDHRDTGRSTRWPAGAPGYGIAELQRDPLAVLDGLGVERAHVAGLSMGGGIAQHLALAAPDRIASLTVIATSPIAGGEDLPDPAPELLATWQVEEAAPAPPADAEQAARRLVEAEAPYQPGDAFEPDRLLPVARRVVARSPDLDAAANHLQVVGGDDAGPSADLGRIGVPTLVIHGDADPLFPLAHGRALAAAVPGAELLVLPGVGHQLPPPRSWPDVVEAMHRTTKRAPA